ncbi:hypothetical protein GCM10007063_30470 [Lentibacillus kapialis]|uniref:Uncharacterized protein n=1 Tax=Lentibacillus kapialis TaxID=340214 RepID=A0A917V0N2_9BACI|nr:hypothetical protein GCM10007063_30470 [Lentibacillus kapialis]
MKDKNQLFGYQILEKRGQDHYTEDVLKIYHLRGCKGCKGCILVVFQENDTLDLQCNRQYMDKRFIP